MLTFDNVYQAPLGKMKAAVDRWSEMKTKLDTLAEDARRTMAAKAKAGDWRGMNAEVTKPFIDKTTKEFADAAKAAEGIHKILQQGYEAFKKAQDDLRNLQEEARRRGVVVKNNGTVELVKPVAVSYDPDVRNDPDYQARLRQDDQVVGEFKERIAAILETCDDADVSCSNALKANITADGHNFSAPKYRSLDA